MTENAIKWPAIISTAGYDIARIEVEDYTMSALAVAFRAWAKRNGVSWNRCQLYSVRFVY